jgi:pimeloyl-ACP methyl ester carboxylesterase
VVHLRTAQVRERHAMVAKSRCYTPAPFMPASQAIDRDSPQRARTLICGSASGLHRLAYDEWGEADNDNVLVCVHGLTRSRRDFEPLARALAGSYRVVCPDMPGRGASDWLRDPLEYQVPTYVADAIALIARLDVESVAWLGTSMGGLVGMSLASLEGTPVRRLILNEAGPLLGAASLERIGAYVGRAPRFASFEVAEAYVRTVSAPFGPHADSEWRFLTENVVRQTRDGQWEMSYDPAIAIRFNARTPHQDLDLWPLYDRVSCPTLVIRGAESDLLSSKTVVEMAVRGPRAESVELAGIGHAPTLIKAEQIAIVREFLLRPD